MAVKTFPHHKKVWMLFAGVFVFSAVLSEYIRPQHDEYTRAAIAPDQADFVDKGGKRGWLANTPFQTLMPTIFGFREVLASLMWVQADDYFHQGQYKPILKMIKQITAIDPHQLDVFATGAWHMAYNFMDKRLIPDGVSFLEEGTKKNDTVYDLFFELGYMHYDKTKNYPAAIKAYAEGSKRGTTTGDKEPPSYVRHQLAHAIEKSGDIDGCITQWEANIKKAEELTSGGKGDPGMGTAGPNVPAAWHNWYITNRRMNERLAAVAEREKNGAEALRLWEENVKVQQEFLKRYPAHGGVIKDLKDAQNEVARLKAGKLRPIKATDYTIGVKVTRLQPRLLQVEGTINTLDLAKVRIQIEDENYAEIESKGTDYKMATGTQEWDNATVKQGKFKFLVKLNQDPADMGRPFTDIYPLKSGKYNLTVTFNPRLQPAMIQDLCGWNGEGITARKDLLKEDMTRPGIMRGKKYPLRYVQRTVSLSQDDVAGNGTKVLADLK